MSSTSPYSKDPFHKIVDWVFSKIQKYKMELFFVTVAILLFAGCQNSIMNTLQKHIVGTLFKEIASNNILLWGGAVVFLLLCLVVFSRHIYHRYHYSSKQYFWVGFFTSIYIVFRFFPPHCTQPTHWYWDFIPFSEHWSSIKYFDLWFSVPFGMGIVCLCGLLKKKKNKNHKADLFDDKEEERYYKLFPSRRIQVDFVLTQLNGLGSERSFAFGITCPWGGGKTSFLNGVKDRIKKNGWSKNDFIQREHLTEDIAEECEKMYQKRDRFDITEKDVIFVDYKPWFASGSKHVVAHFLDALQKSLSPYDGEFAGSIAKYRKLLLSLNPGVFKSFVDGTVDFFSVHKDIEDRFKNVERCIQRLNKKILVFMDDLDRLEANELVASLKIIRNTGSFKNVVFFVTYDKEYVLSQLASHFNFDKKDKKQGDRFLEKFFQLEVPLPQLYSGELRVYVNDLLPKEAGELSFKYSHSIASHELNMVFAPLQKYSKDERKKLNDWRRPVDLLKEIKSPRKWKTYVNCIFHSQKMLKGDYDYSQLILMIAFKNKYPQEAYQIFTEMINCKGSVFFEQFPFVEYNEGMYELIKNSMRKRYFEIGNYDLKYMQYVSALFMGNSHNQIGFHRNYLHYYNLSFPNTYIDDHKYNILLTDPIELKRYRDSKNDEDEEIYLGFVRRFELQVENDQNFNTVQSSLIIDESHFKWDNLLQFSKYNFRVYEYVQNIEDMVVLNSLLSEISISSCVELLGQTIFRMNYFLGNTKCKAPDKYREILQLRKGNLVDQIIKMINVLDEDIYGLPNRIFSNQHFEFLSEEVEDYLNKFLTGDSTKLYDFIKKGMSSPHDPFSITSYFFIGLLVFQNEDPYFVQYVQDKIETEESESDKEEIEKVLIEYREIIENHKLVINSN